MDENQSIKHTAEGESYSGMSDDEIKGNAVQSMFPLASNVLIPFLCDFSQVVPYDVASIFGYMSRYVIRIACVLVCTKLIDQVKSSHQLSEGSQLPGRGARFEFQLRPSHHL
jgi:hypothetical protein